MLRALRVILYLSLPTTGVFVNEKVEFRWLGHDDIACEWSVPGTEPRLQPLFHHTWLLGFLWVFKQPCLMSLFVECYCVKSQQWQRLFASSSVIGHELAFKSQRAVISLPCHSFLPKVSISLWSVPSSSKRSVGSLSTKTLPKALLTVASTLGVQGGDQDTASLQGASLCAD